jgi:hypothetical protein
MASNNLVAHVLRFQLSLSSEKYLRYYQGQASSIQVRSLDNKSIRFPAGAIRQFLMHDGIHGVFEIRFDKNNKLIEVVKI